MASRWQLLFLSGGAIVLAASPSTHAVEGPANPASPLDALTQGLPRGAQVMWNTGELNARLGTKLTAVEVTNALTARGLTPLSEIGRGSSEPWSPGSNVRSPAIAARTGVVFDLTPGKGTFGAGGTVAVAAVEQGLMKGPTGVNPRGVAVYGNGRAIPDGFVPSDLSSRLPAVGTGNKVGYPMASGAKPNEPVGIRPPPAACEAPSAPKPPAGVPRFTQQAKGPITGVSCVAAAAAIGRVVEHETGSAELGQTTSQTLMVGGGLATARLAGSSMAKFAGGTLFAGGANYVARAGAEKLGAGRTTSEACGYGAAAATGGLMAGPVGAGVAVVSVAAADGAVVLVDLAYLSAQAKTLEERRRALIVAMHFRNILNRDVTREKNFNWRRWMDIAGRDDGFERIRETLSHHAGEWIDRIYRTHLGRDATAAEHIAAIRALGKGESLSGIEEHVMLSKR